MIPINNPTKEGDEQISDDIIDVVCTFLVTLACGEHYPFITLLAKIPGIPGKDVYKNSWTHIIFPFFCQ